MTFRIDLLGMTDFDPVTVLFSPEITVESWSRRINAPGKMVFSIKSTHEKATDTNLRIYRRVRLSIGDAPGYTPVWLGYIDDKNEENGRIDIVCTEMLGFFAKRFVHEGGFTGEGSFEAFDTLTTANADHETGITEGEGGVTSTSNVETQGYVSVLKLWELLAQAHNAEFQINTDGTFDFVPALGSDKSGSIHFIYRRDGKPGNNLNSYKRGESGQDMANRVYGVSSAAGEYIYDDTDSQDDFGVIADVKQFNEAQDAGTLESMTTSYGTQRSSPPPDFRVVPQLAMKRLNVRTGERNLSGLTYADISIGDLVTVTAETENQSETAAKRIAEIIMEIDENGNETMNLTLSQAGIFITAGYLDANRVNDLTTRIKQIEQVVS
jgi:hypothetical protein